MFLEPKVEEWLIQHASRYIFGMMALECCIYLTFTISIAKQVANVFEQIYRSVNVFDFF